LWWVIALDHEALKVSGWQEKALKKFWAAKACRGYFGELTCSLLPESILSSYLEICLAIWPVNFLKRLVQIAC